MKVRYGYIGVAPRSCLIKETKAFGMRVRMRTGPELEPLAEIDVGS